MQFVSFVRKKRCLIFPLFIDGSQIADARQCNRSFTSVHITEELFENDTWKRFFHCEPAPFTLQKRKQNGIKKRWIWLLSVPDGLYPFEDNIGAAKSGGTNRYGSPRADPVRDNKLLNVLR